MSSARRVGQRVDEAVGDALGRSLAGARSRRRRRGSDGAGRDRPAAVRRTRTCARRAATCALSDTPEAGRAPPVKPGKMSSRSSVTTARTSMRRRQLVAGRDRQRRVGGVALPPALGDRRVAAFVVGVGGHTAPSHTLHDVEERDLVDGEQRVEREQDEERDVGGATARMQRDADDAGRGEQVLDDEEVARRRDAGARA